MIQIPKKIIEDIFEHARKDAPIEACGYFTGKDGIIMKRYPMRNVDASPEHFTLDPKEQFQVIKQARAEGQAVLSVYHTHPASPSRPSEEDIRLAFYPSISYVIASILDGKENIRSFRTKQAQVEVEELIQLP